MPDDVGSAVVRSKQNSFAHNSDKNSHNIQLVDHKTWQLPESNTPFQRLGTIRIPLSLISFGKGPRAKTTIGCNTSASVSYFVVKRGRKIDKLPVAASCIADRLSSTLCDGIHCLLFLGFHRVLRADNVVLLVLPFPSLPTIIVATGATSHSVTPYIPLPTNLCLQSCLFLKELKAWVGFL